MTVVWEPGGIYTGVGYLINRLVFKSYYTSMQIKELATGTHTSQWARPGHRHASARLWPRAYSTSVCHIRRAGRAWSQVIATSVGHSKTRWERRRSSHAKRSDRWCMSAYLMHRKHSFPWKCMYFIGTGKEGQEGLYRKQRCPHKKMSYRCLRGLINLVNKK